MSESPYMTTDELSEYLRRPRETLKSWRFRGTGPEWLRLPGSRLVLYRRDAVMAWLAGADPTN